MELVQRSQIAERSVPLSHEGASYRPVSSHPQDRPVIENMQHSFPVSSMQSSRVPNRTIPPYQDDVHHQHMTTSPGQDSPEVQVVHESGSSMPFSKTSGIPGKALPPSHDLSLHRPFTTHSQNKQVGPFVQESYSLQPNIQNSETPLNKLLPSQGQVPPPIVIEDDPSPGKDHKDEQREDINCDPSLDHHDLSLSEYKLPEFPADIVRKLENGIILKARDISVLLDRLYESVVPYTYYPSQSDYIYLTQRLLEQFPQLIHQAGLIKDCTYKWETWRQKLMHKFKNKRKRQDRDAPGVLHKRMNYTKHFGDLDERPSTTGQGQHGRGDLMGSDCPSDVDDEVFEVVDDVQDVVIKEEESMYHVMPADTTNLGDTPDVGVTEECSIPPPNSQTSRVPEGMSDPFQDPQTHQLNTSQQQDSHVMKCTQESLSVHPYRQSLRIPERSLPPLLNKASNRQINKHLGNKVMDVVQGSCSSKSHMQTSGFPERSMPQSQDHSQDKVPKLLLAMPHSQNQTVVEVEHQLGSSAICGQTSKSSLPPCQEQEERMTEVQHIKSAASRIPDKPSLYNYKLPEFPADIIQKLENGIPIEPKDRSSLLDTLYDSVVPYTYYPSAADYIYLINIFLEQYPQLLPQAGPIQNCPDMWEAWRQKLMHKFKNKRKRQDRDAPAVREHTRKHLRSLEGLDELPSSDGQDLNERGYWIACDCPIEADDEIFEIVDDDQDVTFEEEHSKHVVTADTTNFGDLPDKVVARSVQESISSSPSIQSQGISERSFPLSQGIASDRTTSSCSQNKPVKDIAQDCTSGIPGKNLPFSQDNATYLLATSDSQNKPVSDSCHSQPYMQTSRIPEKTLPPSQAVPPATVVEENFSSSAGQSEKQSDVTHMESTTSSLLHKPSLYDYKLPEFPSDIMRKLKHGIPIEPRDRSVLLDVLYESIVPYTYYPSSSDYTYFTQIFLEQFPQLLPQAGHIQYCSDNWEAWKQKLMHKFKNKRKRQDRHALAVREHTRKNFRYFQGLDELHGTGEQDLDGRRDAENSSRPNEADDDDDDIFEVVDVVEEVMIKKEESMYHVMPADTTNFGDTSEMS